VTDRAASTTAVIVPCRNEQQTVAAVVADFRAALPRAQIHVFDNASTDGTAEAAEAAGAVVHQAIRPGKGNVVRKMFSDVDADLYVMVDGDATYDASAAPALIDRLQRDGLDMVIGARVPTEDDDGQFRAGHERGNRIFSWLYRTLFGLKLDDVFSGYRVFTRRFVKSFPAASEGFDIETEFTVHAADLRLDVAEVPTDYGSRPEGSHSKLATYRDGFRILSSAVRLFRHSHPRRFYGGLGVFAAVVGLILGIPVVVEFIQTGEVPRFPTAFLAASLEVIALVLLTGGLIISSVRQISREQRRLAYLAVGPVGGPPSPLAIPEPEHDQHDQRGDSDRQPDP